MARFHVASLQVACSAKRTWRGAALSAWRRSLHRYPRFRFRPVWDRRPAQWLRSAVTYGPETIKGYEAGVKFQAFDRRRTGDITAYNYLLKGLQISAFDSRLQTIFLKNAGSARTAGIEGNFNIRATSEITLRSNFGVCPS